MRRSIVVSCASVVVLSLAACAHAPETVPGPDWSIARASTTDTFHISGQGDSWGVKVTDDELLGLEPDFALARRDGEIRGRALGSGVVVGFHGDEGAGVYRGAPYNVHVEQTAEGLHVTGIFGAALSDFTLTPDRLNGRVGACGWDVRWLHDAYQGYRGCGSRVEPISLQLPATMARWSNVEVAGALGLLMNARTPIAMDRLVDNSAEFRDPFGHDPALSSYYALARSVRVRAFAPGSPTTAGFGGAASRGFGRSSVRAGAPSRMSTRASGDSVK